jgi:hypothetical protein
VIYQPFKQSTKMNYEHKTQRLAPTNVYYRRLAFNFLIAFSILGFSLLLGIFGYRFIANAGWVDAIHNACMILSGMGPVIEIKNTAGKLFSSFYALFSGVIFITNIGIILAPAMHRLIHRFHLQEK